MKLLSLIIFLMISRALGDILNLTIGADCKKANGKWGKCKHYKKCFNYTAIIDSGNDICGYDDDFDYVVCCEPPQVFEKAIVECEKLHQHITEKNQCDPDTAIILGGQDAKIGEFPHAAALGSFDEKGVKKFKCGGSLISNKFILTAAHCENITFARLGYTNIASTDENDRGRDYYVKKVHKHEQYNPSLVINDIALLELNETVTFTRKIYPACLYYHDYKALEQEAQVIGWGNTEYTGSPSNHLQKLMLTITRGPKKCSSILNKGRDSSTKVHITETHICAYGGRNKDTCQGDSGGPLQVRNKRNQCLYDVLGITSHGIGCGFDLPSIYTRVYSYVKWIQDIVWPENYTEYNL